MGNLGPTEIILILLVVVLLFGAKKLPELARGSGRALRIFKAETKGLMDDDQRDESMTDPHGRPMGQLNTPGVHTPGTAPAHGTVPTNSTVPTNGTVPTTPGTGSHGTTSGAYPVDDTRA